MRARGYVKIACNGQIRLFAVIAIQVPGKDKKIFHSVKPGIGKENPAFFFVYNTVRRICDAVHVSTSWHYNGTMMASGFYGNQKSALFSRAPDLYFQF